MHVKWVYWIILLSGQVGYILSSSESSSSSNESWKKEKKSGIVQKKKKERQTWDPEFTAEGLTLAYFSASSLISFGTSSCLPFVTEMRDKFIKTFQCCGTFTSFLLNKWVFATFSDPAQLQLKGFVLHLIMYNVDAVKTEETQIISSEIWLRFHQYLLLAYNFNK